MFRCIQRPSTNVILIAFLSRVFYLLVMALSCHIISSLHLFYPGDDVSMFHMRLECEDTVPSTICFCSKGDVCDLNSWKTIPQNILEYIIPRESFIIEQTGNCAAHPITSLWQLKMKSVHEPSRPKRKNSIYRFLLLPLTRWDAARFLSIAIYPSLRNPFSENNSRRILECNIGNTTTNTCDSLEPDFRSSEQAHAFFPLVPFLFRWTTIFTVMFLPPSILPSTFEASTVLVAFLINTFCFIGSAYVLQLLISKKFCSMGMNIDQAYKISIIATYLFCFNPANVFFVSSYSESIFAFLTFSGYYSMDCGLEYPWSIIMATVFWTMASLSRSNGILTIGFILFHFMSKVFHFIYTCHHGNKSSSTTIIRWIFLTTIFHLSLAIIIALPLHLHDFQGYQRHCHPPLETRNIRRIPDWCVHPLPIYHFSLYAHVQETYWNVGFLRYYKLKQIPNFILAFPILFLGTQTSIRTIRHFIRQLFHTNSWLLHSKVSRVCFRVQRLLYNDHGIESPLYLTKEMSKLWTQDFLYLLGIRWMGHVFVLGIFCLIGASIAHIQISTRLICSSCPVIYVSMTEWYLNPYRRKWLLFYLSLFNILGTILHPNWLPWT